MIRIKTPSGQAAGHEVCITDRDGVAVPGVASVTIHIEPDDFVRAVLTVRTGPIDVWARPVLTLDVLQYCAASHGLRLVPIDDNA